MIKIFKSGIELKWVLLLIGIIAISGIAEGITDSFITDSGASLFDAVNVTQWIQATQFIDADNITYYVNPAGNSNMISINTTAINITSVRPQLTLDTTKANDVSRINFNNMGANKWIIDSRGTIDTPNHRLFIADASGTERISVSQGGQLFLYNLSAAASGDWAICKNPTTKEITVNTGVTTCTVSSEKYKHNIKTITTENLPDNFMKVRPIKFVYNHDKTDRETVGFSAQELALLYPEVVAINYQGNGTFVKMIVDSANPNKASGALYSDGVIGEIVGVNYELYTTILTSKLQEQTIININQQNDINTLKYEVELLKGNTTVVVPTLITSTTSVTTPWWKIW